MDKMKKKQIILIGGAPTSGKSTIARRLSKHLDLPWISTDQIRDTMRLVADKEQYPDLFNGGLDAETFLNSFSAAEIVNKEAAQSKAAWIGIKAFIEEDYTWPQGFIVEGVNILPDLYIADFKDRHNIKAVFLIDRDRDRMRKVVFERGLWGNAKDYPDYVKEKEIEWAALFGQQLEASARKHGLPVIEVHKNHEDINQVLKALHTAA